MKNILIITFFIFIYNSALSEQSDKYFHIGKMESHNKKFTLYFKTRENAILARGEDFNYVTDYPQDLYLYDHNLKKDLPLISYEWFPNKAKLFLMDYDYPVFPEDFAYYLQKIPLVTIMETCMDIKIIRT